MKYFVQIVCIIMLIIVLSLTTCQHIENSPRKQTEHPVPANTKRLPNRVKFSNGFNGFANVIVFLLFLHLMVIISNRFFI